MLLPKSSHARAASADWRAMAAWPRKWVIIQVHRAALTVQHSPCFVAKCDDIENACIYLIYAVCPYLYLSFTCTTLYSISPSLAIYPLSLYTIILSIYKSAVLIYHLSTHLPIWQSILPSFNPSIRSSISLSIYLSVSIFLSLPVLYLSTIIYLPLSLSLSASPCLSVYFFASLFTSGLFSFSLLLFESSL